LPSLDEKSTKESEALSLKLTPTDKAHPAQNREKAKKHRAIRSFLFKKTKIARRIVQNPKQRSEKLYGFTPLEIL
jgi:hypothetical protein